MSTDVTDYSSFRSMATGGATTLLAKGIVKLQKRRNSKLTSEEIDHIENMPASAEGTSISGHFVDAVLEKLLNHAIPEDTPTREMLNQKLNDSDIMNKPGLSIPILISNFKQLSKRMGGVLAIQYGLIHILTWKKPTKTLSALVIYTATCLWPHLVLAYPLIFLLFGILIPGFVHRHPMRTPELIKVKKRGQSLLSFLNESEDKSIIDELVEDRDTDSAIHSISSNSSEGFSEKDINAATVADGELVVEKKSTMKTVKSQMALLNNMRDLQNMTTDLLKGYSEAQKAWFETCGFKDEKLSTLIFYGVIVATSGVLFFGQFIPWRFIFIQSGWVGITLCHPKSKKFLVALSNKKSAKKPPPLPPRKQIGPASTDIFIDRKDIIVDDSPEVRMVEVFELQMKSILKKEWSFFRYSKNIFDIKNVLRAAGKRPKGVDHLSKVFPAPGWKFELSYANKWEIDTDPRRFLHERSINVDKLFSFRNEEHDGWIYDTLLSIHALDMSFEFRRRRLVRQCFRYARPVKTPTPL